MLPFPISTLNDFLKNHSALKVLWGNIQNDLESRLSAQVGGLEPVHRVMQSSGRYRTLRQPRQKRCVLDLPSPSSSTCASPRLLRCQGCTHAAQWPLSMAELHSRCAETTPHFPLCLSVPGCSRGFHLRLNDDFMNTGVEVTVCIPFRPLGCPAEVRSLDLERLRGNSRGPAQRPTLHTPTSSSSGPNFSTPSPTRATLCLGFVFSF